MKKLTLAQHRGILIMIFCKELYEDVSSHCQTIEIKKMSAILNRGRYDSAEAMALNFYRFNYYELQKKKKKKNE